MYIWIVEDDNLQMEMLCEKLESKLPNATLTKIATELNFRQRMANLSRPYPDLVIVDVMLRWTDPSPGMPPLPEEIEKAGFYRAGFRCERLIRKNPFINNIPVYLYTVLDEADIEEDMEGINNKTQYIGKSTSDDFLNSVEYLCRSHQ